MDDPITWADDKELHARQRAERGFSDYDWWNFDEYIAWVIAGAVKKFRENGCGHPARLTQDEWNSVLDEMIDGFGNYARDGFYDGPATHRALELFNEYFVHLWD